MSVEKRRKCPPPQSQAHPLFGEKEELAGLGEPVCILSPGTQDEQSGKTGPPQAGASARSSIFPATPSRAPPGGHLRPWALQNLPSSGSGPARQPPACTDLHNPLESMISSLRNVP